MVVDKDVAYSVAEELLKIKAVKLNPVIPFTWASGLRSPIYCDNRKILSYPSLRTYVKQQFVKLIQAEFGDVDVIAGVATGAIAHGVLVAQEMGLPFVYIRPQDKKHGLKNKIEGHIESGQSVVIIEDLISTGKSSLLAFDALIENGNKVKGMAGIFTYLLKQSEVNFIKKHCRLITLTDYDHLLEQALISDYINKKEHLLLKDWKNDPQKWSDQYLTK